LANNIYINKAIFISNTAADGSAVYIIGNNTVIENCIFNKNHATLAGGVEVYIKGVNTKFNNVSLANTTNNAVKFEGDNLTVTVNGGEYQANTGFLMTNGSINDAEITVTGNANMRPAVYSIGDVTIEGCTINSAHNALAVSGNATLNVVDCVVNAPADCLAFQVYSSGGTINVTDTTYTGKYGTSGKMNSGRVAIINIDGVEVYRKGTN